MWSTYLLQRVVVLLGCIYMTQWGISLGAVENISKHSGSESGQTNLNLPVEEICEGAKRTVLRPHSVSITDFGAVGDGITLNSLAFQNAIFYLRSFAHKGGAQLYVPQGRWLTGSFSLISHLTLFLDEGAVILGSQDPRDWPLVEPLPSYGRGRELPGWRYISLIYGENLEDVIITGGNGTIDGQGSVWWNWFHNKTLNHTRGHLVEFINSKGIVVSNITLLNSPFWTIHPVYCSNVVIQGVTILSPPDSPNTDGIQPGVDSCITNTIGESMSAMKMDHDSCSGVCIEDCYISNGADAVSIKSGWDEYGIKYGLPSANIVIRRVISETPNGAGIAFGSEMSGGIKNVQVKDVTVRNSKTGIKLKTAAGRGGYVTNISITNIVLDNVYTAIGFTGNNEDHPDNLYDPAAYPIIERIFIQNITGRNISYAGSLEGLEAAPFKGICLSNITLEVVKPGSEWDCCNVQGFSYSVTPQPCPELLDNNSESLCSSGSSTSSVVQYEYQ